MEFTNRLSQQLRTFWASLSRRQQVLLGGSALTLMVGLMALVSWANQIQYKPLFPNMTADQAGPVVEALKARKELYRVTEGGSLVEVPADRVAELRLALAGEGLMKDGVSGFELFDKNQIGSSAFKQELDYKRALEGELKRTINSLEQVENSRVHLVLPKDSLFSRDQTPASASVVLKLKPGARLEKSHIQAIASVVSASIEGLTTEHVSIVDTSGRLLLSPSTESNMAMNSSMLEYSENMERTLEQEVARLLERVVGPGKVSAVARVSLDLASTETTAETYDPDIKVSRSEQQKSEVRRNGADAEGVPGTTSNLPETGGQAAASNKGNVVERKESTSNFEIPKTVSRTVQQAGQVKRLSIAVVVDGTYKTAAAAKEGDTAKAEYVPRTAEEMKLFEQIVKSAVGFNAERGDQVSVSNLAFHALDDEVMAEASVIPWEKPTQYVLVLVGMMLVFALLRPVLKQVAEEPRNIEEAEAAAAAEALAAGADPKALPGSLQAKLLTAGNQDKQRREELVGLATSDLDNTVQTVRDWLR